MSKKIKNKISALSLTRGGTKIKINYIIATKNNRLIMNKKLLQK